MRIYSRAEWGARRGDGDADAPTPAAEVWLHHTETRPPGPTATEAEDFAAMRGLERIGDQRFGHGISYTFAVMPSGRVLAGHSVDRRGTHTKGHNTAGRAIVLVGDYRQLTPTEAALTAAAQLLAEGLRRGWWQRPVLTGGHRDVVKTLCPGEQAYRLLGEINRRANLAAAGVGMSQTTGPSSAAGAPDSVAKPTAAQLPRLHAGQRGAAVKRWQEWLLAEFPDLCTFRTATGYFGKETTLTTRAVQAAMGVTGPDADGRNVGPRTNAAAYGRGYRA